MCNFSGSLLFFIKSLNAPFKAGSVCKSNSLCTATSLNRSHMRQKLLNGWKFLWSLLDFAVMHVEMSPPEKEAMQGVIEQLVDAHPKC